MDASTLHQLLSPTAAFVSGAIVSIHCSTMCGPLSCSLLAGKEKAPTVWTASVALYHFGRVVSYALLGGLAGGMGGSLVSWLGHRPAQFMPWAFALFFAALALNLDSWLTRWQARHPLGRKLLQRVYRLSGTKRGVLLGLLTPLIPCGPLYLMLWVAASSASVGQGTLILACFCAGTVPLLALSQSGYGWMVKRFSPQSVSLLRRLFAVIAVISICTRAFLDTDLAALISNDSLCH